MKKNLVSVFMAAIFSLTFSSCSEKPTPSQIETENTETEAYTSATSGTSFSVQNTTQITLTDTKGLPVTDSSGNTVTKIVAADNENKPITNSKGEYEEPKVSHTTTASESKTTSKASTIKTDAVTTTVPESSSSANDTSPSTSAAETSSVGEITTEQTSSESLLKIIWTCDNGDNVLNGDGNVIMLNFKIKDDAVPGNYDISIESPRNQNEWSSLLTYEFTEKVKTVYGHGIISVGKEAEPEDQCNTSEVYSDILNSSGNPGETISVPVCIMNNPGDIGAMSYQFRYNSSVFEFISVTNGPALEALGSKGSISFFNQ